MGKVLEINLSDIAFLEGSMRKANGMYVHLTLFCSVGRGQVLKCGYISDSFLKYESFCLLIFFVNKLISFASGLGN